MRRARLMAGTLAALCLSLGLAAGPASAKTVYDYVYSGSFIDGSQAGRTFGPGVSGLVFDHENDQLFVANGGVDPTWVGKYAPDGKGRNFTGLASPIAELSGFATNIEDPTLAVDMTGGPNKGNIYLNNGVQHGFKPNGTPLNDYRQYRENSCGVAVTPEGEPITVSREGFEHWTPEGTLLFSDYIGYVGLEPTVKKRWGERGRICRAAIDPDGDYWGIRPQDFAEPPSKVVKVDPEGWEIFEVNSDSDNVDFEWIFGPEEKEDPASTGVAIDSSNGDVVILSAAQENNDPVNCPTCWSATGKGSFSLYDNDGRFLGGGYGGPEGGYLGLAGGANGVTVDADTHDVWVANRREYAGGVRRVEKFERTNPHTIADATTIAPDYDDPGGESVTLQGIVNPDGVATTKCRFLIADRQAMVGHPDTRSIDCAEGQAFAGDDDVEVSVEAPATKGKRWWYRLIVENADGYTSVSNPEKFTPQGLPIVPFLGIDRINTDGARLLVDLDPNGGNASYEFEWGQDGVFDRSVGSPKTYGFTTKVEAFGGTDNYEPGLKELSALITGLTPGETYEYRVHVTNEAGTTTVGPRSFTTYVPDPGTDPCANSQVRQQTEASLLPDCRAYELVSARNTGGYDVESDIVPGQQPLDAYPRAKDSLLYSLHFGVIPGIAGSPTNHGLDPYVATRGPEGWSTRYVGVPADGMADKGAFGSPLLGADADLSTFAFGGEDICDPCFEDGSTDIPLRMPDGSLRKGMGGSSGPVGEVREALSEDGSRLFFGAEEALAPDGPDGAPAIYARDLRTDVDPVELISTDSAGDPLSGEVAQLDTTADGERTVIGRVVGEDGLGNKRYDLYLHDAGTLESVLVADTPSGVLYAGMSADAGRVFFTTSDAIAGDGDTSADLFRADVGSSATATVTRVSTGSEGTGDTDACTPITDWNVLSGGPDCSVVAIAGGAGVGGDGSAYFVSPEKLDGAANGESDQANLYVVHEGEGPRFVGTLDSSLGKPGQQPPIHPPVTENLIEGLEEAEGMAVDQDNGDIYISERGEGGRISRYTAAGAPKKFTAGPGAGSHRIPNSGIGGGGETSIAVDSSGGLLDGAVYVPSNSSSVNVYAETGELLGNITGFGYACGLAVDQKTGELFVGDYNGSIRRFAPTSAAGPIGNANYTETSINTNGLNPCHLAVDSAGHVFAVNWSNSSPLQRFDVADFAAAPPTVKGDEVATKSTAMYADASTGELYNVEGNRIDVYDSAGNLTGTIGNASTLGSNSLGVAVNEATKHVYALNGAKVVEFGLEEVPYRPIDNAAVVHGVRQPGVRSFEDLQITPDGRYAVFSSPVSLTGYVNLGFDQVYRYDAQEDQLACPSCAPSGAVGGSDVRLSGSGLNVTDDGRVFFTSGEAFTLRDTNEKRDVYEWKDGKLGLISTGIGQYDSGLVTVGADGTDAFFFTRDTLTAQDESGKVVKIYTAREGGGYLFDPPRLPCAASDECHGAGSAAPGPPPVETGTPSDVTPKAKGVTCKKGFVKKRGKCVKTKKPRKKGKKRQRKGGR